MSTNDNPKTKTMITYVDGGFPTGQYEYDRHDQLRSLTYQNYYSTENIFFLLVKDFSFLVGRLLRSCFFFQSFLCS